jgi:hypothetical protein
MGAISVLLVLVCLTILAALIGSIGVAFGIAAADFIPGRRWWAPTLGGGLGGLIVGASAKLLGLDAFNLLLGAAPGDITVAFLSPDLAVAGNADDVRAAIDRRDTPTVLDAALSTRAGELSATQDAWFVSLVPPPVSGARLPDPTLQGILNSGALNGIQQTSGGVKFGANVDVTAEAVAATAQDANTLASIARLLASLAQSNAQGTTPATLLQSLTVATSGNTVQLALSIPESLVEQLAARRSRQAGTTLRRRR